MGSESTPLSKARLDSEDAMCFAVELKFLVPVLLSPAHEPQPFCRRSASKICQVGDESHIGAQFHRTMAKVMQRDSGQQTISIDDIVGETWRRQYSTTHWIVKKSNSAEPSPNELQAYEWMPVEISSPKFPWKDNDSMSTVQYFIRCLHTKFWIVSNHTCEVHVHVGRLDGRNFSLQTLKRLAAVLWVLEPTLRAVKNPRSPNYDHAYTWSSALRQYSRLAASLRASDEGYAASSVPYRSSSREFAHNRTAIASIHKASSYLELGRLLTGDEERYRRLGFNFNALIEEDHGARSSPKTIECRFLEGSMDADILPAWIGIFATLAEMSLDGGRPEHQPIYETLVDCFSEELINQQPDLAFGRLLERLGLHGQAYKKLQLMIQTVHVP